MKVLRHWTAAAFTAVGVGALLLASAPAAHASEADTGSVERYLADNPQISIVDEAILGSSSAVIVGEDGLPIEYIGEPSAEQRSASEARAGCDYRNAVFVNYSGWQESLDGCSIIGYNSSATYNYQWSQDTFAWNSGPSCVQGRGYSTNAAVNTPSWFNAGCGVGGSTTAHIGNRATVAKIRGAAMAPPTAGYVRWR